MWNEYKLWKCKKIITKLAPVARIFMSQNKRFISLKLIPILFPHSVQTFENFSYLWKNHNVDSIMPKCMQKVSHKISFSEAVMKAMQPVDLLHPKLLKKYM